MKRLSRMMQTGLALLLIVVLLLPVGLVGAQDGTVQEPYIGMWLTGDELAALPTSGTAWEALVKAANASSAGPDVANQDNNNDVYTLAKALVYARTGEGRYRDQVIDNLKRAVGTEKDGRTLALGRNLVSYVIAADLINLPRADASFDTTFRAWLRTCLTETLDDRTLISTHEERPNNWGTHAGASRTAVALYLGDRVQLERAALVMRGWLGDWDAYHGFDYGLLDWQCDASKPVGINPKGCAKSGKVIDGAQPEEMRRGGGFKFPPAETGYPWEALQGTMVQAMLLDRAGYDVFEWEDRAILRAVQFLYSINWPATGDDIWQVWLINQAYGTNYAAKSPAGHGKNMGWTDWSHQVQGGPLPGPVASSTPKLTTTNPQEPVKTLTATAEETAEPEVLVLICQVQQESAEVVPARSAGTITIGEAPAPPADTGTAKGLAGIGVGTVVGGLATWWATRRSKGRSL